MMYSMSIFFYVGFAWIFLSELRIGNLSPGLKSVSYGYKVIGLLHLEGYIRKIAKDTMI